MLKATERELLDRLIAAEDAGEWVGDVERGREVMDAIGDHFVVGVPREDATADLIGCLLERIDDQQRAIESQRGRAGDLLQGEPPSAAYRAPEDPRWAETATLGRGVSLRDANQEPPHAEAQGSQG